MRWDYETRSIGLQEIINIPNKEYRPWKSNLDGSTAGSNVRSERVIPSFLLSGALRMGERFSTALAAIIPI
jgi:hypothetical protein